ncbi:hypothetical protein BJX76DRAFT_298768 [Aspergillus varians]
MSTVPRVVLGLDILGPSLGCLMDMVVSVDIALRTLRALRSTHISNSLSCSSFLRFQCSPFLASRVHMNRNHLLIILNFSCLIQRTTYTWF